MHCCGPTLFFLFVSESPSRLQQSNIRLTIWPERGRGSSEETSFYSVSTAKLTSTCRGGGVARVSAGGGYTGEQPTVLLLAHKNRIIPQLGI